MRLFNKLTHLIIAFISLSGIAFADSTGIVFDWQPFIVNCCPDVNHPVKRILPKYSLNYREISKKFNNSYEFLPNDLTIINNFSPVTTAKKSVSSKIKISLSTVSSFMLPYDEIYSRGYDGKLFRAASILPSLLRNPSREMAIETLKLIEPQVNLGFEF